MIGPVSGAPLGTPDHEHFREVYLGFFPRLRAYFLSQGFSLEDAEDLSQKTLWNVYKAWDRYSAERGPLDAWVYAVGRNAARDEWRRKGRDLDPLGEEMPSGGQAPEEAASEKQELSLVAAAMLELPARMRACLLLRVQEELPYKEIARRLSLSSHTVKVQIWNARRRLNQRLGKLRAAGDPA